MKLHTKLSGTEVREAMEAAKLAGKVTPDVYFVEYDHGNSRTHAHRFEIQLGTDDKHSLPAGTVDQYGRRMNVRRYKNSGNSGANSGFLAEEIYAATWDEWGWFIAEIMRRDPEAVFGTYRGIESFNAQTDSKFVPQNA